MLATRSACRRPLATDCLRALCRYIFHDPSLLRLALVDPSAAKATHNQQLAWQGDTVLQLLATEALLASPEALGFTPRGKLVGGHCCTIIWELLGLDSATILRHSDEASWSAEANSIMEAKCLKAVLGAVYVDGGLDAAHRLYHRHFLPDLLRPASGAAGSPSLPSPNAILSRLDSVLNQDIVLIDFPSKRLKASRKAEQHQLQLRLGCD